jgi:hypothetical protein
MKSQSDAAGRQQRGHIGPGFSSVAHVLHHHARDDEIELADQSLRRFAGYVELGFRKFLRTQAQFARVDIVDRDGDAGRSGLGGTEQRAAAAADFEHADHLAWPAARRAALLGERQHDAAIIVPGPSLRAIIAEPPERLGKIRRRGETARDARRALGGAAAERPGELRGVVHGAGLR